MDKLYVLVTGNGTTSRANLEALLEDYFFKKNTDVILVLSYSALPSQGQIFCAQYAKDKGKEILVFAPNDSSLKDIPGSSFTTSQHPINEATVFIKGSGKAFLLWNPSDSDCVQTLEQCVAMSTPVYDLTTGLVSLSPKDVVAPALTGEADPEPVKSPTALQTSDVIEKALADIRAILEDAFKKA